MHSVPATISLTARLRIKDEIPDFPELKDAHVKRETDAAFPGTQGEIRFALTKFSLAQIGEILQRQRLTIGFGYLNDYYHDRFWDEIPDECAGGFLSVDGFVSFPPGIDSYHIVPMGEPLYTNSRPDGDADHSRHQPQVLSGGGGIPILSNRLISALKQLGVEGEIAILIYRGFNKKAYDTRQPGFKRYLPQARFEMIDEIGMNFLPAGMPVDFPVSAVQRRHNMPWRDPTEQWYEIAVPLEKCLELREMIPGLLFHPIFRRDGLLHRTQQEFEAMVTAVNATGGSH